MTMTIYLIFFFLFTIVSAAVSGSFAVKFYYEQDIDKFMLSLCGTVVSSVLCGSLINLI